MTFRKTAIVLHMDGLRPNALGPYGNTWFDTPHFNQLASQSLLFEYCLSETPCWDLGFESILTNQHPIRLRSPMTAEPSVFGNVESMLITDQNLSADSAAQLAFDRVMVLESNLDRNDAAANRLTSFFAQAMDCIAESPETDLYWMYCGALSDIWDAPYEYRHQLADEEDPEPGDFQDPPSLQFNAKSDDPDQLLNYQQSYGGQILLLDQCLEILLELIQSRRVPTLFCLTATRGYPLGEHGVVGYYRQILNNESIHVPCLVRWPLGNHRLIRSQSIVSPRQVLHSVLDNWLSDQSTGELDAMIRATDRQNRAVVSIADHDSELKSIQTPAWKYISGAAKNLYLRPDDLWEFNDVVERCPEIAHQLGLLLEQAVENLADGNPELLKPLADELVFGVE